MRIMDKVDQVKMELEYELPSSAIWDQRVDLPATHWGGGPDQPYFPLQVRDLVNKKSYHDEL